MSIANEIQRLQSAKANIKSAIEEKGVTVGDGTIDTYAEKIGEISVGSGVELERGLKTATFTDLNIFGKKEVELNFDNMTSFMNCFVADNQNTTVEHITINCPNAVISTQSMFYCTNNTKDLTLKRVTLNFDTSNSANCQHMFTYCQALETIDGQPLNFSGITVASRTGAFTQCIGLVDVRFEENSIPLSISFVNCANLSTDSIQSIIDGLATVDATQTLTLHSTVGAKLTDTQKATITAKNWTLVY